MNADVLNWTVLFHSKKNKNSSIDLKKKNLKSNSRVGLWYEAQQFTSLNFIPESHLCNVVQEEIELSEPALQRDVNHLSEIG